jgi:predicted AAA+ superfamily ATPase
MIKRTILENIIKNVSPGFINIIYGPRRVGKTVLLQQISDYYKEDNVLFLNGDTEEAQMALERTSEVRLSRLVEGKKLILIDEAQRIPNVSLSLKIIIDKFPDLKIFVTGSSSLSLTRGAKENLVGRNKSYRLFPLSFKEKTGDLENYQKDALLSESLIFGAYPYLLKLGTKDEKIDYLKGIASDYLFKDVMMLERIDYTDAFKKLASLLAFQIGQPVSINELARNLGVDYKTVGRYLDLLEKSFVIFGVSSFSNNLRKEVVKSKKYYFYDLGIRNTLVGQFSDFEVRDDAGALWENFLFLERIKKNEYNGQNYNYYFWRGYQGKEIDFIEEKNEKLFAYEFKLNKKRFFTPKLFKDNYNLEADVVNRENYQDFIL